MTTLAMLARCAAVTTFSLAIGLCVGPIGAGAKPAMREQSAEPAVTRLHDAVAAARRHDRIPDPLYPAIAGLHRDLAGVGRCDYSTGTRRLCRRGRTGGRKVLVELGDSHARAWIPALQTIAKRTGYATYYLVRQGCTAAKVTPDHGHGGFEGCVSWRRWAFGVIRRLRPEVLLITSALPDGVVGRDGRRVTEPERVARLTQAGLVSTIRALRDRVGHLVVLSDAPGLAVDPAVCLVQSGADLGSCASAPSDAARLHFEADRAAARATGVPFVSARSWFCWLRVCPAVVGATVTYRDGGHITTVYARSLAWPLQHALRLARLRG